MNMNLKRFYQMITLVLKDFLQCFIVSFFPYNNGKKRTGSSWGLNMFPTFSLPWHIWKMLRLQAAASVPGVPATRSEHSGCKALGRHCSAVQLYFRMGREREDTRETHLVTSHWCVYLFRLFFSPLWCEFTFTEAPVGIASYKTLVKIW